MEEAINSKIIQKNQIPSQENIISNEIESNKTPKPKFQDQRSLSPSKIIKKNSFKIVPIELFEEELDNYMNQYLQNLPNNYSESFLSKADQILKEEKICKKIFWKYTIQMIIWTQFRDLLSCLLIRFFSIRIIFLSLCSKMQKGLFQSYISQCLTQMISYMA